MKNYRSEEIITLPYNWNELRVLDNEWVTDDVINSTFVKFYDDLTAIDNASKLLKTPPIEYYGWFGSQDSQILAWAVNLDQWVYQSVYLAPGTSIWSLGAIQDYFQYNGEVVMINKISGISDSISYAEHNVGKDIIFNRIFEKTIGDDFVDLKRVGRFSDGSIAVLDGYPKNRIVFYDLYTDDDGNYTHKFLNWIGGIGGLKSKKFKRPIDMKIDSDDKLWILDSELECIKKLDQSGTLLKIIQHDFLSINPLISFTIDLNGYKHIIRDDRTIIVLDDESNLIRTYKVPDVSDPGTIKQIISGSGQDGSIYICTSKRIAKFDQDGTFLGFFAERTSDTHKCIYHDEHKNLYIPGSNSILNYIDLVDFYRMKLDTSTLTWPASNVSIDKNEYIQDWVVNKSLARLWDNIEIVRQNIILKPTISHPYTNVNEFGVRNHTTKEYTELPYQKNDIYIGVNEFVSAPVVNRCFKQLFKCVEHLKGLLSV